MLPVLLWAGFTLRLSPSWGMATPSSGLLATYLATPAQAGSLPWESSRCPRLDFWGPGSIPKAIIVAKGWKMLIGQGWSLDPALSPSEGRGMD